MTQQRLYDFGALLTQTRSKTLAGNVFTPGVYAGMAPTVVSPVSVTLSAGAFMLPNGVLVVENGAVSLVPPVPTLATDYTLTADHDDIQAIGGSTVSYTWRVGLLDRSGDPSTNSLAILWLRHPGSAPVTIDMFSVPEPMKSGAVRSDLDLVSGWYQAPFPFICDHLPLASNITVTAQRHSTGPQHLGIQIVNSAGSGTQAYNGLIPLTGVPRARFVDVYADIPTGGSISFSTGVYTPYDTDGNAVATTPTSIAGAAVGLNTPVGTLALDSTELPVMTLGFTAVVPALTAGIFIKGFRVRAD